jgi:DNA-binding NtrC family response regulator
MIDGLECARPGPQTGHDGCVRVKTPQAGSRTGADESPAVGENAGPLRVLCVDDNDMVLKPLVGFLKRMGCVVTSAANGEQAWKALQAADFDFLLTDHDLPGLRGTELAVKTRQHGLRLPIIVMSGAPPWHVNLDETRVPNAAFLGKPFGPEELVRTFNRLQGRKRLGMLKYSA